MSLNLERQLRFYGAYHHDPVNIVIHAICVPIILITALTLATQTPSLLPFIPAQYTPTYLPPNLGIIVATAYSGLYILMEPVAGSLLAVLIMASTAFGSHLIHTSPNPTNNVVIPCVIAHVASWIAQFVGHGKFEGRAPALLDNLFQAIFLAPLFVWLEMLFQLGYREELKTRLDKWAVEDIAKFRLEKRERGEGVNGRAVTRSQTSEAGVVLDGDDGEGKGTNGHIKSG